MMATTTATEAGAWWVLRDGTGLLVPGHMPSALPSALPSGGLPQTLLSRCPSGPQSTELIP